MESSEFINSKRSAASFWIDSGLVFLVLLVVAGDPAPDVNEAHYLCRLKHYWDFTFCPGDQFLESPDAHFTVVWLLGWVTRFTTLETTAWIGRVLSWALIALGWRRLSGRVTTTPLIAPLSMAGLAFGTSELELAGEWIVGGFEAKTLAYGFVLLGLADALADRWNRAWILLGVASALHALVGGWTVIALAIAAMTLRPRPAVSKWLPGLCAGGLISLAGVVPALRLNLGADPATVAEANTIYVYYRLPHHLALLSMRWDWLLEQALCHTVALIALVLVTRAELKSPDYRLRLLIRLAWVAEGMSATGLLISLFGQNDPEWAASLLRYYWHRLADIATPLAVVMSLGAWIGRGVQRREPGAERALLAAIVAASLGIAWLSAVRLQAPLPRGDQKMVDQHAWKEMTNWIRENTAKDAIFLTPRLSHSFKWRAHRAEVVTWKDVPQNAETLVDWRDRVIDVFSLGEDEQGSPQMTPSLARLGASKLRELGDRYGASYALDEAPRYQIDMPLRRRASLPIVHRVGPYTLYELRPR